jgi:hypothetical protein
MKLHVNSVLSWPMASQDCLEAPGNGAWPVLPQRRWEQKLKNTSRHPDGKGSATVIAPC